MKHSFTLWWSCRPYHLSINCKFSSKTTKQPSPIFKPWDAMTNSTYSCLHFMFTVRLVHNSRSLTELNLLKLHQRENATNRCFRLLLKNNFNLSQTSFGSPTIKMKGLQEASIVIKKCEKGQNPSYVQMCVSSSRHRLVLLQVHK